VRDELRLVVRLRTVVNEKFGPLSPALRGEGWGEGFLVFVGCVKAGFAAVDAPASDGASTLEDSLDTPYEKTPLTLPSPRKAGERVRLIPTHEQYLQ